MKHDVQIKSSYCIWKPSKMRNLLFFKVYNLTQAKHIVIKNYNPLIIEWWIHNIGYYLTKPFVFIPWVKALNVRFKDVDLIVESECEL